MQTCVRIGKYGSKIKKGRLGYGNALLVVTNKKLWKLSCVYIIMLSGKLYFRG
jgi:hypothetical protein